MSRFYIWRRRRDSPLNYLKPHRGFLPIGSHFASLLEFVSHPTLHTQKNKARKSELYFFGAEGGIRTHAPFRTNGFQDRLVMTTSIPLRFLTLRYINICFLGCQEKI